MLDKETKLTELVKKSDSINTLNSVITELNSKYQEKGSLKETIKQIEDSENIINDLVSQLRKASDNIYTDDFSKKLQSKIDEFNKIFSDISYQFYQEKWLLKCEKQQSKKSDKLIYRFETFSSAVSTGKKQGEILAFDLAYREFAAASNISHFDFLLNDKKELMHDNQLFILNDYLNKHKTQVIISMLSDKIPLSLAKQSFYCVELSQNDKLFRFK